MQKATFYHVTPVNRLAHAGDATFADTPNNDDILGAMEDEGMLDLEHYDFTDYSVEQSDSNKFIIKCLGHTTHVAHVEGGDNA